MKQYWGIIWIIISTSWICFSYPTWSFSLSSCSICTVASVLLFFHLARGSWLCPDILSFYWFFHIIHDFLGFSPIISKMMFLSLSKKVALSTYNSHIIKLTYLKYTPHSCANFWADHVFSSKAWFQVFHVLFTFLSSRKRATGREWCVGRREA